MTATTTKTGETNRVLATALEYAAGGIYVFPLRYGTDGEKKTNVSPVGNWRNASSTSPEQIRKWFGPGGAWQDAALAIDCGRSGLVVVDLDVSADRQGPQEWAALNTPSTWRVRTPTGGEHWYYREDPAHVIGNDQSAKVAPGVDVRGLGGFVIAPPTVDGRGRYAWVEGAPEWSELSAVPPVVVERMRRKSEPVKPPAPEPVAPTAATYGSGTPWTPQQAEREINRNLDALATAANGTRNGALNNTAMRLGHFVPHYLPTEAAVALMTERACGIGLDESEILPTINSGLSAGMREPYTVAAPVTTATSGGTAAPTADEQAQARKALMRERMWARLYDRDRIDSITPPTPLIDGVLDVATIAFLSGKFGTYKTFVSVAWACSVATGTPWEGREIVTPGPVLYVAAEGCSGLRARVRSWEVGNLDGRRIAPDRLSVYDGRVKITEPEEREILGEFIQEIRPVMVVLDTLHKCAPGMEENSSKDMGLVLDAVADLRERYGVTVLLNHHTGHNGDRSRGSSSLEDDADTSWVVRLADPEDRSASNQRTLVHRKVKDRELLEEMPLALELVEETGSGYVRQGTVPSANYLPNGLAAAGLIKMLDELGVPQGAGRDVCRKALGTRVKASTDLWSEAIRRRKAGEGGQ